VGPREPPSLRVSWEDLLARRPQYRESLRFYGAVLEAWSRWSPPDRPVLDWSPEQCHQRWLRGVALVTEAPPAFDGPALEPLLQPVLDELALMGAEEAGAVERFARAWDEGRLSALDLLPGIARESAPAADILAGIPADVAGLITYLGLRPAIEAYFARVRQAFEADLWDSGVCPFCAAPPSFGDIVDDGKRWLSCALCGGRWTIGRLRCPFCDNRDAKTLTHLGAEGAEDGYLVDACDVCLGYLKAVDRRLRWNVGPALVEDWGTPHLDLIARRKGYWRATPSLTQLPPREE
jgi:Protein involved in formate dehydrogenase formation